MSKLNNSKNYFLQMKTIIMTHIATKNLGVWTQTHSQRRTNLHLEEGLFKYACKNFLQHLIETHLNKIKRGRAHQNAHRQPILGAMTGAGAEQICHLEESLFLCTPALR